MELRKFVPTSINEYLNEKYSQPNIEIIKKFYPQYYQDSNRKTEMVGWSSKKEQYKRFC